MKNLLRKFNNYMGETEYVVGFISKEELFDERMSAKSDYFSKIHWINTREYKKGWFADPFILSVDSERIHLLAEEKVYSTGLGRLVHLIVDRKNYSLIGLIPILELDTHLSFPIYYIENGTTYVYPENYESGSVRVYEYDRKNERLINPQVIIDAPLVDTQIIKIEGNYYAMGVRIDGDIQESSKTLHIYKSDSITGHYAHIQEIHNHLKDERGAGQIMRLEDGTVIRPVQGCERYYGYQLKLNRLLFVDGYFKEELVGEILPDTTKRYGRAIHTLNTMDSLCVVDGRDFIHYPIAGWLQKIKKMILTK